MKLKRLLYFTLFAALPFISLAQKQGNIWYFGTRCGLDFSSGRPVSITGGMTGTRNGNPISQEGTSAICDFGGKLLFYTTGVAAWNRTHKIMPHGDTLDGHYSSSQAALIVPKPGSSRQFYVFTNDANERYNLSQSAIYGYRYSMVDMCLDSGRGDIVTGLKNKLMKDSATEKLAACYDGSGGYWVIGHQMYSNKFLAWHLTEQGIIGPVISPVGSNYNNGAGQLKISPSGKKIASASMQDLKTTELFDFDLSTGVVSAPCIFTIDSVTKNYGLEFSPNSRYLYVALWIGPDGKRVFQYDVSLSGCSAIEASRQTIYSVPGNCFQPQCSMGGMQAGPDGRIYFPFGFGGTLACIQHPDNPAASAALDTAFVAVNAGASGMYTLPSFVAGFQYFNKAADCPKPNSIQEYSSSAISVLPNPAKAYVIVQQLDGQSLAGAQFLITDLSGRIVKRCSITASEAGIMLADLPAGLYLYQVSRNGLMLKRGKLTIE